MHVRPQDLAEWLRGRVVAAGAQGLVVGLSGGVDSAVVAGLCQLAVPDRVAGVILPCHSDPTDASDARLVADHFRIPAVLVNLEPAYDRLLVDLQGAVAGLPSPSASPAGVDDAVAEALLPLANVKPRLRMVSMYFVANSLNYLVAGTTNRCERTIGYVTKYGDGGADLLPIGNLLKSEVRALARDLGVPDAVVEKPPSAGLWAGQTDEGDMGFTYAALERYLTDGPESVAPALALRIERLIRTSEHKRSPPDMPDAGWEAEPRDRQERW